MVLGKPPREGRGHKAERYWKMPWSEELPFLNTILIIQCVDNGCINFIVCFSPRLVFLCWRLFHVKRKLNCIKIPRETVLGGSVRGVVTGHSGHSGVSCLRVASLSMLLAATILTINKIDCDHSLPSPSFFMFRWLALTKYCGFFNFWKLNLTTTHTDLKLIPCSYWIKILSSCIYILRKGNKTFRAKL